MSFCSGFPASSALAHLWSQLRLPFSLKPSLRGVLFTLIQNSATTHTHHTLQYTLHTPPQHTHHNTLQYTHTCRTHTTHTLTCTHYNTQPTPHTHASHTPPPYHTHIPHPTHTPHICTHTTHTHTHYHTQYILQHLTYTSHIHTTTLTYHTPPHTEHTYTYHTAHTCTPHTHTHTHQHGWRMCVKFNQIPQVSDVHPEDVSFKISITLVKNLDTFACASWVLPSVEDCSFLALRSSLSLSSHSSVAVCGL